MKPFDIAWTLLKGNPDSNSPAHTNIVPWMKEFYPEVTNTPQWQNAGNFSGLENLITDDHWDEFHDYLADRFGQ